MIFWSGITRECLYDSKFDMYRNSGFYNHALPPNTINYQFMSDYLILSAIKLLEINNIKYAMSTSFNNILYEGGMLTPEYVKKYNIKWIEPDRPNNTLFDIITTQWNNPKK